MESRAAILVAAFVVMAPLGAAAQTAQPSAPPTPSANAADEANHWIASGFVGSDFGNNAQSPSMNFGGALAYLWKDRYGAEIDTGFTPSFQLQNNFFGLGLKPQINSYMANAILAKPFGDERVVQPFVSGGVGALSLRSSLANGLNENATRFGGDIGGGLMAFAGDHVGFKADVRYFRATGSYNTATTLYRLPAAATLNAAPMAAPPPYPTPTPSSPMPSAPGTAPVAGTAPLADSVLSGLHFWKANVGVALRW